MGKKSILFVDDEPNILSGLRRMLRPMRRKWELTFANSGAEALEKLEKQTFDAVVTDIRMPGMDGLTLLQEVEKRSPGTIRFALSGHYERDVFLRSIGPAHQFLAKPCKAEQLKQTLSTALALQSLVCSKDVQTALGELRPLPEPPERVRVVSGSKDIDCAPDGRAVLAPKFLASLALGASDVRIIASILPETAQPDTATTDTAMELISQFNADTQAALLMLLTVLNMAGDGVCGVSRSTLLTHAFAMARTAEAIAKTERLGSAAVSEAFMAGLLHDVGRIMTAARFPDKYEAVLNSVQTVTELNRHEKNAFGANTAHVSVALCNHWGFANPVLEAVGFYRQPADSSVALGGALTALHIATALSESDQRFLARAKPELDTEYLETAGLSPARSKWRQVLQGVKAVH